MVGLAQSRFDGDGEEAVGGLRVALAVEEEIRGRGGGVERLARRRIPAMGVAQQLRRAVDLPGGSDADVRRVGQASAAVPGIRAEIGRPRQPGDRADDVAASQGAMRAVLDSGGDASSGARAASPR